MSHSDNTSQLLIALVVAAILLVSVWFPTIGAFVAGDDIVGVRIYLMRQLDSE